MKARVRRNSVLIVRQNASLYCQILLTQVIRDFFFFNRIEFVYFKAGLWRNVTFLFRINILFYLLLVKAFCK